LVLELFRREGKGARNVSLLEVCQETVPFLQLILVEQLYDLGACLLEEYVFGSCCSTSDQLELLLGFLDALGGCL